MRITAINKCHCTTVKGNNVVLAPGQTDNIDDRQANNLIALRAARSTDEVEVAVTKRASRKTAAKPTKKKSTKRTTTRKTPERASDEAGDGDDTDTGAGREDMLG